MADGTSNLDVALAKLKPALYRYWSDWDFKNAPTMLYHYCAIESMYGIFGTKAVWASDVLCLEDRSELKYACELASDILDRRHEVPPEIRHAFTPQEDFNSDVSKWRLRVFCLSGQQDSPEQWRAYSKNGRGFALGFDRHQLIETRRVPLRLQYDPARQTASINYAVDTALDILRRTRLDPTSTPEFWLKFRTELFLYLLRLKNPAFAPEKEWRVLVIDPPEHDRFRTRAGCRVPYVALCLTGAIRDLWQGPNVDPDFAEQSLRPFLQHNGFDHIQVHRSSLKLGI